MPESERVEFVIRIHDVTGDDIVAGKEAMFLCDVHTKLVNGGRVDPGQPVDPSTRVDMFDPSLVKIDKFLVILTG